LIGLHLPAWNVYKHPLKAPAQATEEASGEAARAPSYDLREAWVSSWRVDTVPGYSQGAEEGAISAARCQ